MKLPRAIEILNLLIGGYEEANLPDKKDAIKLGIEALQFLERWRSKAEIQPYPLLPSETTD